MQYTADEYTLIVPVSQALNKRIEANFEMWLNKAISEDYDRAAAEVRAARDKMLAESDKEMVIDRMNLEAPTGASFSAWLDFLRVLQAQSVVRGRSTDKHCAIFQNSQASRIQ